MKNYITVAAITSILLIPALFADTTGTGTTTSTGTTSTGVVTGTGTTGTGTTGTGTQCNTGTVQVNQAALLAAQLAFSTEIGRLITVKQAAYAQAMTLTGSAQIEALKSANQTFRTGFQIAIKKLQVIKQSNKSNHSEFKQCRKEEKRENHEERNDDRKERKDQIQVLKNQIKEIKYESHSHR